MQDLTMSSAEEEYDGTSNEEEFESDEGEKYVSQMRFLSSKKRKITYEELNISTEPPPPLPQNYKPRDFRRLTQSDGNGHLSTSVATTSTRVEFKCRSLLVKLREIYLILIEGSLPRDFSVHTGIGIGTRELMVLDESYTEYGNALRIFPDMEFKDYEKGSISFSHLRTYLDHTRVNIKDPANTNTIFREFMLLYFGDVLFGNSKSWARLELLGPIAIIEKKGPTINFGSAILRHLYYCLDQASKQEYQCYEYCQVGHHILIDNRLDDFWPRMSA
ncbi:hypothetical protein GIB67_027749 [Kingdonia uniflora]|uniref:Uncharacterized protein n=1 Tax=Kingdonia uniflora TaxID=39325 RepID=A0A7J7PC04_9MAGN|nr:hypothetical protein GIB67_027749 [Kingdonia uniflora]